MGKENMVRTISSYFSWIWKWTGHALTIKEIIVLSGGSGMITAPVTYFIGLWAKFGVVEKTFLGIGIFLLITALFMYSWSKVRKDMVKKRNKNNIAKYASKIIIDSKASKLLAIPDTLWQMSIIENSWTDEILNNDPIPLGRMQNIVKEMEYKLKIIPQYSSDKKEIIKKTTKVVKQLKLDNFDGEDRRPSERQIVFMYLVYMSLNNHKDGLYKKIKADGDANGAYSKLEHELEQKRTSIKEEKTFDAIEAATYFSLGANSLYIFINSIPPDKREIFKEWDTPSTDFVAGRDAILRELRRYVQESIEDELYGTTD